MNGRLIAFELEPYLFFWMYHLIEGIHLSQRIKWQGNSCWYYLVR